MKIRTKLVLLLSAALVVTSATSTWLRLRWTRERLEQRMQEQAYETALAIAEDLERQLRDDADEDDISERLKYQQRKHRDVDKIEFTFDQDEDTTVSFHLEFTQEDPHVQRAPRPARKLPPGPQRRDALRRALLDHGESTRPPAERAVEPLWRTPDKAESSRWSRLDPRPPPRRASRPIVVDQRDAARKEHRYVQESAPVDPEGPTRGQVTVWMSLEDIDRLVRTEEVVSVGVALAALVILMLLAAVIVDRVVGKPVEELARAMREVEEQGDLKRRVREARRDEIGALSRGFNAMIARLGEASDEIQAFNRRLADEVRAATIDLERKNQALAQLNRLLVETRRELGDKERLAALGQLAAQLAHELGTPLSSVSGHLQLAMGARDLPPPLKERLQVATRELGRVSKIVRDYLDSTRPVAPARVPCDLGRVVEEAVGIVTAAQGAQGGAGGQKSMVIERKIDAGAANVETDPGLVRQILVNLITNAVDATAGSAAGGRVVVAVSDGAAGGVEIAVTDDGMGIRAEDAARIFEPFYTTKGRGKGTGLGLAICRELTQALGGRISVASAPGAGSTFTVTLPRGERGEERRALRAS